MQTRSDPCTSKGALVALTVAGLWLSGSLQADTGTQVESRVDHFGLSVEFSLRCSDTAVQLHSTITNTTTTSKTIQSGGLPWQYDVLGSEFTADSSGNKLKRDWTAPILGRTGPITLMPQEHRDGDVPISVLFPNLRADLKAGPVVVHWKYWTGLKTARTGPSVFEGSLVIRQNACNKGE
jgi:hypothetical protein